MGVGDRPHGCKVRADGAVTFDGWLYGPEQCCEEVLRHFHHSRFVVHPGCAKMYHDLSL